MDKLWILNQEEELQAVLRNRGAAVAFFDAKWKEVLNGAITFEFSIPADCEEAKYVVEESYVLFRDPDLNWQEFIIKEVDDSHESGLFKKVYCEHSSSELLDFVVEDIRPENKPVDFILDQILSGSRWEVGNVTAGGDYSHVFYHVNKLQAIHDLVDLCGGELAFRTEVLGNQVVHRYVDIYQTRGEYRGKRFVYGKDITGLKRKVNTDNLVTAVIGLGKGVENEEGTGYGRRLKFTDVEWKKENGDPADKPMGQDYIEDQEAREQFGKPYGGMKLNRTRYVEFSDIEDPAVLLQLSWEYLQKMKTPQVTYEIGVIDLETAEGYEHEYVRLGDTVNVIDRKFNPELRIQARVVEIERDLNNPEDTKITLGNVINNFQDAEKQFELDEAIKKRTQNASWLEGTIDALKNNIKVGDTSVISDTFIVYDKPPDQNPTKAIMLGNGMLAIANSKNGPDWNWRTFITGDMVVADLIQAGTMLADRIRGGDLYLGGIVNGIGKNGKLFMLDENDEVCMQFDAETRSIDRLFVGEISGNNVVKKSYMDTVYYIDPLNGSDENDGLTATTAFKTFDKPVSILPEHINSNVTLKVVGSPTFDEEINLYGFFGSGVLTIDLNGSTMNGYIRVANSNVQIYIQNGTINHSGLIPPKDPEAYGCIGVSNSNRVTAQFVTLNANGKSNDAFFCDSSFASLLDSAVYGGKSSCVFARDGSQMIVYNVKGSAPYGFIAYTGAKISGGGTRPGGTTQNDATQSGGQVLGDWSQTDLGTNPGTPTIGTKIVYNATSAWSWDTSFGWNSNGKGVARQGDPSRWDPSMGNCKGLWFFDYQGLQNALQGKTPKSIRIKIKRQAKGGVYKPVPIFFWTHNLSSASGGEPALSNSAGELAKFSAGEEKWVNLPTSFANALRDGTAKGIAIYTSNTNSDYYARFEPSATLEISV